MATSIVPYMKKRRRRIIHTYGEAKCGFCKNPFIKKKSYQEFCSSYCRYRAHLLKSKEEKPTIIMDGETIVKGKQGGETIVIMRPPTKPKKPKK